MQPEESRLEATEQATLDAWTSGEQAGYLKAYREMSDTLGKYIDSLGRWDDPTQLRAVLAFCQDQIRVAETPPS